MFLRVKHTKGAFIMIGDKIRQLRKRAKISQEELAAKVGEYSDEPISRQSISGWETGKVIPRTANLKAVAQALEVPLSSLIEDNSAAPMSSDVTPITARSGRLVTVPLLSPEVTACCGSGIPVFDEIQNAPEESYRFTIGQLGGVYDDMRPPYAVRADGACLEKSGINNGDILIFNPALEPRQGQVCVVCWGGALSAKKVVRAPDGSITLYSDVDTFTISADEARDPDRFAIWGPVVQLSRALR